MAAVKFTFRRASIQELARQGVMQAAMKSRADEIAARAAAASPEARIDVSRVVTRLANLDRAGYRVTDDGPNALKREFGTRRTPGARVLGRLAGEK